MAVRLTEKEKANRYDALVYAIGYEKGRFEKQLKELDSEISKTVDGSMAGLLIGRKYAYKEVVELLERWC